MRRWLPASDGKPFKANLGEEGRLKMAI